MKRQFVSNIDSTMHLPLKQKPIYNFKADISPKEKKNQLGFRELRIR